MTTDPVTILLVEDDKVDVAAVKRAFAELRISNPLVIAKDGLEALDLLRGTTTGQRLPSPRLILLDLALPRMNGIDFLDALRSDPDLDKTIVFVLTTSSAKDDRIKAYERHISGYVVKTRAGRRFTEAISMIERYWKVIEFPVQ